MNVRRGVYALIVIIIYTRIRVYTFSDVVVTVRAGDTKKIKDHTAVAADDDDVTVHIHQPPEQYRVLLLLLLLHYVHRVSVCRIPTSYTSV